MGLDLTLFSISTKAKFLLEKARINIDYANDFDKIQDTKLLKRHLEMVKANPDGTPEHILEELIEDSKTVLSHYPDFKTDKYQFNFRTSGYETLNYLLKEFLKDQKKHVEREKIFYGGTDIYQTQYTSLQFINNLITIEISNLLQSIDFSNLIKFYDYQKMDGVIYKLTKPENLNFLKADFEELKAFFFEATKLNAFVVIKIW